MNMQNNDAAKKKLDLWGGLECTVNRVNDAYFSQLERNGHATRNHDLERFASLGITAIRYPVLWERTAPESIDNPDWSWPDQRLAALRDLGITPIAGLVHHGSGPRHTSLIDPDFALQLAQYAGAVAKRYPWIEYYTPVNEPLTTARFSGLYGVWYPHGKDDRTFIQALLTQCRAVVLSMQEIRKVNPAAKLVQTDDLGKTYSTPAMADIADFYNHRRWLAWDLLCGMVDETHALWRYLTDHGAYADDLLWFRDHPCPPDIIGINYYITGERWLDERIDRYPERYIGGDTNRPFADIEAARALATPTPGIGPLLQEAWERYGLPIAVTEAHIDANREDQMRWLLEIWLAAKQLREHGVDIRAVTVWALLGSYDWNCLVTACNGYYEPGPFDVRSPLPRPTAVANLMRELASGKPLTHPVLQRQGWWRRPARFFCQPVATRAAASSIFNPERFTESHSIQPILITGATGTLGSAFARMCEQRNLAYRVLTRKEMDIADPSSVAQAIECYQPWAVINAGGYVRVDDAESAHQLCFRENTLGPSILAAACAMHDVQLLNFSSDLVFDGRKFAPYIESDPVSPLNIYGKSKADAEEKVLRVYPRSLMVRTSAFFGPWDEANFVTQALNRLSQGESFSAASDVIVSPTFVPDLVRTCLDLLIDKEHGIWHLTNATPVTWAEFAYKAAEMAGISTENLQPLPSAELTYVASRPGYSALGSERGVLLPPLEDALARYVQLRAEHASAEQIDQAVQYGGI